MNADRITIPIALLALAASSVGAAFSAGTVQRQRRELELVEPLTGTEGMPPHVALVTAALGTFRGLAVDVLWARADHLQTEGEYFEAQTLSQWITALQPRFDRVWGFQAWNLSYNISAATQAPAERWGWVQRGIGLLRDQGIPLNPRSPELRMELGWIFHHKIAGRSDRQHWYYKARLAREMQELLGDMTTGQTADRTVELFRRIATAPSTIGDVLAQTPRAQEALDLLAAHGAAADENLVRMLGRALMQANSRDAAILGAEKLPPGTNLPLMKAIRADKETATLLFDAIVPHLQRRALVEHYRMDPARMVALMEQYGPLDWRHAESHGIYWTEAGIDISRTLLKRADVNELMIIRSRLHMLADLMRSGRVDFDPVTNRVDLLPDPRFAAAYERSLEEALALIRSEEGVAAADFGRAEEEDLLDGYENFLNLATILEYLYGDRDRTRSRFEKLVELADRLGRGDDPLYADTVETFVALRIGEVLAIDVTNLRQFLDAMIRRSFLEGLAKGDLGVFNRYLRVAHSVYDKRFATSQPGKKFVLEESKLLEFPKLVDNSFVSVMKQTSLPLLERARIWAWAPEALRTRAYPEVGEALREQAEAEGFDPARAFPQPPAVENGRVDKASEPPATDSGGDTDEDGAVVGEETVP
jgi:hypothetical protein